MGILDVETVVMTLPAWKTFLASWHAYAPVPLTSVHKSARQDRPAQARVWRTYIPQV